ncbi:hypothetical protein F2P81_005248 [Scophthalmus maximus]|uniref:Uncharacterized protein n=1 Tax=Scophthalmus maximus TaxID=52904 RepID=A0A6A4T2L6_SCOMX|nr:hypothetical protein F2P81_005248 [Scophthalmus maximus]
MSAAEDEEENTLLPSSCSQTGFDCNHTTALTFVISHDVISASKVKSEVLLHVTEVNRYKYSLRHVVQQRLRATETAGSSRRTQETGAAVDNCCKLRELIDRYSWQAGATSQGVSRHRAPPSFEWTPSISSDKRRGPPQQHEDIKYLEHVTFNQSTNHCQCRFPVFFFSSLISDYVTVKRFPPWLRVNSGVVSRGECVLAAEQQKKKKGGSLRIGSDPPQVNLPVIY